MNDLDEKQKNKIAVVGSKDTVLIFKALGMDVFYTDDADVKTVLKDITTNAFDTYPIIMITEREYIRAADFIATFDNNPYPVIMPIPDGISSIELGNEIITQNHKRATGGIT